MWLEIFIVVAVVALIVAIIALFARRKKGKQGAAGPAGVAGMAGVAGPPGAAGAGGLAGPQGMAGPAGPIGLIGPIGLQGATGPVGAQGVTGPIGPAGAVGAQGPTGAASTVPGPTGGIGATGATGEPLNKLIEMSTNTGQAVPNNVVTNLTFQIENNNEGSFPPPALGTRFTPDVAGYYIFCWQIVWGDQGGSTAGERYGGLVMNGNFSQRFATSAGPPSSLSSPSTSATRQNGTAVISMNGTTDYVEVIAFQNSGSAFNIGGAGGVENRITVKFLSS